MKKQECETNYEVKQVGDRHYDTSAVELVGYVIKELELVDPKLIGEEEIELETTIVERQLLDAIERKDKKTIYFGTKCEDESNGETFCTFIYLYINHFIFSFPGIKLSYMLKL